MKKIILSFTAIILATLLTSPVHSEEVHNVISANSLTFSEAGDETEAYFHIYDSEDNENIDFTIERTEFDAGPVAHYKVDIVGSVPTTFYYSIQEGNTFSATILKGHNITAPLTIRITDVNRHEDNNPGWPSQEFKLTLSQKSFPNTVFSEDFTYNMNGWETYTHPSAAAYSYTRYPGELVTTISDPGNETWHVHTRTTGIPIVAWEYYKVKIRVKQENGGPQRAIKVRLEEDGGDYTGYGERYFVATNLMQEYTFIFRSRETDPNAVLCIESGNIGSTDPMNLIIDYIKIFK